MTERRHSERSEESLYFVFCRCCPYVNETLPVTNSVLLNRIGSDKKHYAPTRLPQDHQHPPSRHNPPFHSSNRSRVFLTRPDNPADEPRLALSRQQSRRR